MKKILFVRSLKENFRGIFINLACVVIITMMTVSCAGTNKTQTALQKESELSEITGDQTIECRRRAPTGSRLKKKICKTKAQWAREDQSKQKTAEKLQKDTDRSYSTSVPVANDSGSFPGASVPR